MDDCLNNGRPDGPGWKRCGICGRKTKGRILFQERWMLCDACATRAMGMAQKTACHDCGEPTYGVAAGGCLYDICIGCFSRRQQDEGMIEPDVAVMRRVFSGAFEWRGQMDRFLHALEKMEEEND